VYKNKALARDGDQSLYDKVVKMGGLPKRLDRLIDETGHLQVDQQHSEIPHHIRGST
jgi:hypothetical protein